MRKLVLVACSVAIAYALLELSAFLVLAAASGGLPSLAELRRERAEVLTEPDQAKVGASLAGDDVGPIGNQFALHPYYGFSFESAPGFNDWGFFGEPPPFSRDPDTAVVAITGGSVAFGFCRDGGREALLPYLTGLPPFQGRRVQVVCMAVSGFKQPQQLYVVLNQLLLGVPIEMLINLDGFNEITAPVNNAVRGIHPGYPASNFWLPLTQGIESPSYMRSVGWLVWLREARRKLAVVAEHLRYSVTATAFWSAGDRFLRQRITDAQVALDATESKDRQALAHFRSGPQEAFDEAQARRFGVELWANASRQLDRLAQRQGFAYFHFLQPNQYVLPPTKVFTDRERTIFQKAWKPLIEEVRAGYPLLREAGARLSAEGIAFYDLTQIFSESNEWIWIDPCCHLTPRGAEIMAHEIGQRIDDRYHVAIGTR